MRSFVLRLFTLIGVVAGVGGCSDSTGVSRPAIATGPTATAVILPAPTLVSVVTRDTPLAASQSASAVIGPFGGQITLPGAGLTVTIPPLAVGSPTLITVTAVAGAQVAYEFEPHGIQFNVPLIAAQTLSGTSASVNGVLPSVLYAGYFQNVQDLNQANATALVSELLGTSISSSTSKVRFAIWHFSGYLIATGEAPPSGEGSQE